MLNGFDAFFLHFIPNTDNVLLKLITSLADPKIHLIFWGIISVYLFWKRKSEVVNSKPFYFFIQTSLIMFFCGILKITVGRARPFLLDHDIIGFYHFSVKHAYLSFPSSHMAIATALAYSLRNTYKINFLIYIYPLLIAFTRLSLRAHFATDVLIAIFIGLYISKSLLTNYRKYIIQII